VFLSYSFRHGRYMWIPFTDLCVVVSCTEADSLPAGYTPKEDRAYQLAPMRDLLLELHKGEITLADIDSLSFAELRDKVEQKQKQKQESNKNGDGGER
jgi:hypothetical protein